MHYPVVGCNNKHANNIEVTSICLNIHKDEKSWLAAISRGKGNLPSIYHVFICSDQFEDKYCENSQDLVKKTGFFYAGIPIARKLILTAIPTLLPHK